jgi:hypothetical protein
MGVLSALAGLDFFGLGVLVVRADFGFEVADLGVDVVLIFFDDGDGGVCE